MLLRSSASLMGSTRPSGILSFVSSSTCLPYCNLISLFFFSLHLLFSCNFCLFFFFLSTFYRLKTKHITLCLKATTVHDTSGWQKPTAPASVVLTDVLLLDALLQFSVSFSSRLLLLYPCIWLSPAPTAPPSHQPILHRWENCSHTIETPLSPKPPDLLLSSFTLSFFPHYKKSRAPPKTDALDIVLAYLTLAVIVSLSCTLKNPLNKL